PGGRPLLELVMAGGRRTRPPERVDAARERRRAAVERLPTRLRSLATVAEPYPVRRSTGLEELIERERRRATPARG
ncbi:MAG: nicotinate phosphoribosyltransferase, partial [Thermodesulfobacteriota bacterium]